MGLAEGPEEADKGVFGGREEGPEAKKLDRSQRGVKPPDRRLATRLVPEHLRRSAAARYLQPMSILWDAPMTAAVARELREELLGSRIRAVRMDRESRDLVLHFRERTLVFRLHPLHGDVALLEAREPGSEAVTLNAHCREIRSPPDERLLMLQFQPPAGGASPEGLVVELMTNQWNAVWVNVGSGRIRRILWSRDLKERKLTAGEVYRRPAPSDRQGIDEPLDPEEWDRLLTGENPKKRLLRSVAFTSSLNAPALLGVSSADHGAEGDGYDLWRRIRGVALGLEKPDPRLLETAKRSVPYPLPLPGMDSVPADSLLQAFGEAGLEEGGTTSAATALIPSSLLERLDSAVDRARGKVERLREELADAPDPEQIRGLGDLILARFSEIPRGSETVTLEDFQGEPVEVELDPSLSTAENADRYYNEASKVERAREQLPTLIERARERFEELGALREEAEQGTVSPDTLEEELPPEASHGKGERGGGRRGGGGKENRGPSLPYRRYRSSGGLEIRVGRGARANDDLTFHHSSPDDVWLHARQVAGAHVILRWQDEGNPPARDLAQAASLAALHSDARHASSVPVDWTRRKYVRSPRKSPPGVVVPDRVKTVFVDPDPELARRLKEDA